MIPKGNWPSILTAILINQWLLGMLLALVTTVFLLLAVAVRPRIRYIVSVLIFIAVAVIPIVRPMGIPFRGPPTSGGEVPLASNLAGREPLLNNVALHDSPAWPAIHEFQARLEAQLKSWRGRAWVRALPGIWGLIILMLAAREWIGYSKWRRARRTWQVAPSELREFLNWRAWDMKSLV